MVWSMVVLGGDLRPVFRRRDGATRLRRNYHAKACTSTSRWIGDRRDELDNVNAVVGERFPVMLGWEWMPCLGAGL
jgi:hypothetical protein